MKIHSLELKNFRRFDKLAIDFNTGDESNGGLTVLVAKNGEGKTSILDAINIVWGTFIGAFPETKGRGFKRSDIRTEYVDERNVFCDPLEVTASFSNEESKKELLVPFDVKRILLSSEKKSITSTKEAHSLSDYAKHLLARDRFNENWPIIAYYGDKRLWAGERFTEAKTRSILSTRREHGYVDATNPKSGYKDFGIWFPSIELAKSIEEVRKINKDANFDEKRLTRFCNQFYPIKETICRSIAPSGWTDIVSNIDDGIWLFNSDRTCKVPLASCSAGVKAVLGLVGDIAYRCTKLNPHLKDKAIEQTTGIVLIDEIELHLHPSWQQTILPTLRELFPRIQFIVTTHSPQVVSSVSKECIRIIENNEVELPYLETQGAESQQSLIGVFGTDPAPPNDPFVIKLNEYEVMSRNGLAETKEGIMLFNELKDHFGLIYPPLQRIEIHRKFGKNKVLHNAE